MKLIFYYFLRFASRRGLFLAMALIATMAAGCHKDYSGEPDLRDYSDLERVQTTSSLPSHHSLTEAEG